MSEMPSQKPGQLPLDLPVSSASSREDLLESGSNRLAIDLVDNWPDWPSNTVILAGPVGAGKSHIAAVWAKISQARILSVAELNETQVGEVSGNFVLEDALAGAIDEVALFHLLNRVRSAGDFIMITSREFPSSWNINLPDLASRLKLAHLVELHEPDDRLLSAVIVKLFADRQIEVSPALVDHLVTRMERSLGAAGDLVAWLDREALARHRKINRQLVSEALIALGMA
jgi:chromosomal replication initiation ATPase DnaA